MSGDDTRYTGRCLCGQVRYEFTGPPSGVDYCHCDSCRRNCSAPVTAFIEVPRDRFKFTGAQPKTFDSSPGIRRLFCGECGSPVAYDGDWDTKCIHLYLVALDEPEAFAPKSHVFVAERLSWFEMNDKLPHYPGSSTNTEPMENKSI